LPTKFLTYLSDTVLDYPFHLIEKYVEIKEDVLKRFSLSVPSLIIMSGVDDFSLFATVDASVGSDNTDETSSDIVVDSIDLNNEDEGLLHLNADVTSIHRLCVEYKDVDFDDYLIALEEETLDENFFESPFFEQTNFSLVVPEEGQNHEFLINKLFTNLICD